MFPSGGVWNIAFPSIIFGLMDFRAFVRFGVSFSGDIVDISRFVSVFINVQ